MQLDKEILDFETPDTTDMILRKRAESAYVKLSPSVVGIDISVV